MHKKGISLVFLAGVAFVVIFFVVLKFLKISSIIPNQVKTVSPLFIRKTYSSLKEALINGNYKNYPTSSLNTPTKGQDNSVMYNPKTNQLLELDTSEGGGYKCCEAPTFYVWSDSTENIFWIRTYQADLSSVHDNWYGPFKLERRN
ncbi:hypothetical protein A2115_01135 [Candidatus Woesebacteria bacterium GWA1_41_8]|jgi:hypothetical protein|uniref:Uncharacterized protein n=1 Tax=Candidatus Woesebacteria bacterium GWA1_41_8 TaxID=1802471 RepID=A0A1F7WIE7_9BACT|nr:MAG: hypothetical protein A2115_01135 [Candidatus Woesebacteria bacterium GWA1_41_8]